MKITSYTVFLMFCENLWHMNSIWKHLNYCFFSEVFPLKPVKKTDANCSSRHHREMALVAQRINFWLAFFEWRSKQIYSFYDLKCKVLLTGIYTRRNASYSPKIVEITKYIPHLLQDATLGDTSMRIESWMDKKLLGSINEICLTRKCESF